MRTTTSYLSRIRGVDLLPGERVEGILHPEQGLIAEPAGSGRLLAATNRRLISVLEDGPARVTQLYAIGSLCGVSVRNDVRRGLSWLQWAALVSGAVIAYLILAYWLVDRLPSVIIPVINLHAVAAILALVIAVVVWLLWRSLTHAGGSTIRIEGNNWSMEAQFSNKRYDDLLAFANLLLQAASSSSFPGAGGGLVKPSWEPQR